MKIISKFNDYYDSAVAYGIDETQYLKREQKTEELLGDFTKGYKNRVYECWKRFGDAELNTIRYIEMEYVFFCGKVYPVAVVHYGSMNTPRKYFYSYEKLSKYLEKEFKVDLDKRHSYRASFGRRLRDAFEVFLTGKNNLIKYCVENKVPYAHVQAGPNTYNVVTTYPVLKDIDFAKVVDPYTAFQEIAMYKFGVLGVDEGMLVEIKDKDRIAGKGFDTKYGFRTRPKGGE